jgi:hypothetical protein
MESLPACGLYKTSVAVGGIPAGRLVSFHNHGQPGPGIYLPVSWSNNVATFGDSGVTVTDVALIATLQPVPAQGLYRVARPFHCCEKRCREFETDLLIQLGYNGNAQAIVFVPEMSAQGMVFPQTGTPVDAPGPQNLTPLKVARPAAPAGTRDPLSH